jgi:peptidoglycan/LPS O-acetylase OafA/YrhL
MGYPNDYKLMEHLNLGGLGVYFFFVLSGFLITYLLLKEIHLSQSINLKNFYLRRVLRIWPLYYLILITGFFVLPQIDIIKLTYFDLHFKLHFTENLFLYLLILPNLAFSFFPAVPHIGQSWSIGVEEQFYIIWPLIIKKIKINLKVLSLIFIIVVIIKMILILVSIFYPYSNSILILKKLFAMTKFESMLIGAFGAVLILKKKNKVLNVIFNKWLFVFSCLSFLPLNYLTYNYFIQNGMHILISILFLIIILNFACNNRLKFTLENKILNYLGSISYGIYMYHLMIIPFVIYLFKDFSQNIILFNACVYMISLILSILISGISYRFFERYFLKMKKKYEK